MTRFDDSAARSSSEPGMVLVGTNFHFVPPRRQTSKFTRKDDGESFPVNVTLGFRHNFWRVFSSVVQYEGDAVEVDWLGHKWQLISNWACESSSVDFARYLDERSTTFLVFVLSPQGSRPQLPDLIFANGLDEQRALHALFEAVAQGIRRIDQDRSVEFENFVERLVHLRGLNAFFSWSTPEVRVGTASLVGFFAFYSFALLMIWKIGREQTLTDLVPSHRHFRHEVRALLRSRSQIINVERYLMTGNVSNDPAVQQVTLSMRGAFRLRQKIQGLLPLNEAMKLHLDSIAQLRADEKSSLLNVIAFAIAVIGLPLTLMGVLLTLSDSVPVVRTGLSYLLAGPIRSFFLGTGLLSLSLLLLIFGVSALAMRRNNRKG